MKFDMIVHPQIGFRQTMTGGVRADVIRAADELTSDIICAVEEKRPWLMTFVNPAATAAAKRSPDYVRMLRQFDVVAPDGIGMALAIMLLHRRRAARISFDSTSLAPLVFRLAAERSARVVLAGGKPLVAERAHDQLRREFPDVNIVGTFDGYTDHLASIAEIRQLAPDIVICGMGSVLQERFLLQLVEAGWRGAGFTCGGYLDQLAQGLVYYPVVVDKLHLRWAYRLAREPRRLWRRYVLDYPAFGLSLCSALVQMDNRSVTEH